MVDVARSERAAHQGGPELADRRAGRRPNRLRMPPVILLCAVIGLLLVAAAALAPWLAPYDVRDQSLLNRLKPPLPLTGADPTHPLGTDQLGRDVLSRLLFALRTTLSIAVMGTLIGAAVGTALGLLAGSAKGLLDDLIMFAVDTQAAIPLTLLALTAVALFGNSLPVLIAVIGLSGWDGYARLIRAQVMALTQQPFIEASRALGSSALHIAARHLLPNVVSPLLVAATLNLSAIVLVESSLSFLGLGVQPPYTSLGSMLGSGRDYLASAWWIAAVPGLLIVLITMVASLLGDWLRDRLDPRLSKRQGPPRPP